jgi:hypothetical protein
VSQAARHDAPADTLAGSDPVRRGSQVQAKRAVGIDGFEYEVDSYSIVDGEYTDDFNLAGGSVVLRGRLGEVTVTVTVSAANLQQALGRALVVLLESAPDPEVTALNVAGYIDSEVGSFMEVDRHEVRG